MSKDNPMTETLTLEDVERRKKMAGYALDCNQMFEIDPRDYIELCDLTRAHLEAREGDGGELVERLRATDACPFCGRDPYHYVNNGVGMEVVAVTCCEYGIALFQHGDEQLLGICGRLGEAADALTAKDVEITRLKAHHGEQARLYAEREHRLQERIAKQNAKIAELEEQVVKDKNNE